MENPTNKSGVLIFLEAYKDETIVGTGWMIYLFGLGYERPVLIDDNGKPLDEGWYQLKQLDHHFIVINESVH